MVKEEAKRVKKVMKQISKERVEQEHQDGEQKLQNALEKCRQEFDIEKAEAILIARKEEQDQTEKLLEELMKQHKGNIARLKKEAEIAQEVRMHKVFKRKRAPCKVFEEYDKI